MRINVTPPNLGKSIFLLQPSRPIFCTTKNDNGTDHVAPFSWIMPISCTPPRVAFAFQNERGKKLSQSLTNVLREREFVVNMPRFGQEHELVQSSYGLVNHACKFDRTGYTRENSGVAAKRIMECTASLDCKVFLTLDSGGDHTLILADVVGAVYEDAYYDENLCPSIPDLLPLINLKEFRFDDRQEHVFVKTCETYRISIPYERKE